MADLFLSGVSNRNGASELLLVSGGAVTGYRLRDAQWGLPRFAKTYTGARGTQGARLVGREAENVLSTLRFQIVGSNHDDLEQKAAALFRLVDEWSRFEGILERRPHGSSYTMRLHVLDASVVDPEYGWLYNKKSRLTVTVEIVTPPYMDWPNMDVIDPFDVDTRGDYAADAGSLSNIFWDQATPGFWDSIGALTTENRYIHVAHAYQRGDQQVTVSAKPGSTLTSFKAGCILKRKTPGATGGYYFEVYVDDNGTNSRLRLDFVQDGIRTNRSSTNLAARVANGVEFWVRGRIESGVVYLEYFTSEPNAMTTPTLSANYTLAGTEIDDFGPDEVGQAGLVWAPQHTSAQIHTFTVHTYAYRNLSLPQQITLNGEVPGDAPALCDVSVTAASAEIPWALVGWWQRAIATKDATNDYALGIIEAENASSLSEWAVTGDGDYRGASGLQKTTTGAHTLQALWTIEPQMFTADDFRPDDLDVEVWARIEIASGVVSPTLAVASRPHSSLVNRYSYEYGSAGKAIVKPSSGTVFRFVRLGVIPFGTGDDAYSPTTEAWELLLAGSTAFGSSGTFGVDYLVLVPSARRALGPTGKANNPSYPDFMLNAGTHLSRRIRSDLSGLVAADLFPLRPYHGLGGSLIEIPTGEVDALVKLSSLVPDDPTSDTTSETLAHSASVQFSVTPRSHLSR